MRWRTGRRSRNIEDRRGSGNSRGRRGMPFPGMGRRVGRRGLKRGGGLSMGMIVIILIIGFVTGQNPLQMLAMISGGGAGGMSMPSTEYPSTEYPSTEYRSESLGVPQRSTGKR